MYESNEKGIFPRKISLKISSARLRWLDLEEKVGNKSVGRRRNYTSAALANSVSGGRGDIFAWEGGAVERWRFKTGSRPAVGE